MTPPLNSVLEGVTRRTMMSLAEMKGHQVVERTFTRDEVYTADELFMTGTAAEVTPIREVDHRLIAGVSVRRDEGQQEVARHAEVGAILEQGARQLRSQARPGSRREDQRARLPAPRRRQPGGLPPGDALRAPHGLRVSVCDAGARLD